MSKIRSTLASIHAEVSRYPYTTDLNLFGLPDFWERISRHGRGDCDDYVLEYRAQCIDAGISIDNIRFGECVAPTGGAHLVLIVHDDELGGDWIMDQTQPHLITIADLKRLGYRGRRLQIPGQYEWMHWKIQGDEIWTW